MSRKPSELLEPRINSEGSKERLLRNMLHGKPDIQRLNMPSVLDEVVLPISLTDIFFLCFVGKEFSSTDGGC